MAEFKPTFAWLRRRPVCFLAFGFGSGLAPKAPGTFGTLPALPMAFTLYLLGISGWTLALLCVALFVAGVYICNRAEQELGIQDYGGIVWDEIVAMLLILAFVPFKWYWWLAAFVVFRLFDAVKPWPIKWFDARIHGGFGIMLDDIIAAFMSLIVLNVVIWGVS
ncbi:phosphatidylglycerophosphatase A family protein [Neisseria perflava]|uniref:phosphatidylglycerophosphatase A family protein n=1 Tax=Neisseria perflava TaxID=33053 RepID=UPI00209F6F3D|nr:phosphatidylglycerophosphatase A [Neisseria perflava]MCP1659795.1 phosphatidylglycerophosphatase A [Neisseria perflava]MCP1771606.1 phosphatidylglycerophosphatase A [Neisseria perflava]